jgi:ribokinase
VFVAAVGDDPYGRAALDRYRAECIDISSIKVMSGVSSGIALIFVGDAAENMIGVAPGANGTIRPETLGDLPEALFEDGDVFLASLEVPFDAVARGLERARQAGMRTLLNPAPVTEGFLAQAEQILALVDVLIPNESELDAMSRHGRCSSVKPTAALTEFSARFGIQRIVVTLGSQGCLVFEEGKETSIPARPSNVIDTVGAGDAFCGALAVALAEGRSLVEAANWAGNAASIAVTRVGAQEGMPRRIEIDATALRSHD